MGGLVVIGLCGESVFLSVPHFCTGGETVHATSLFTESGGKGYNQAVAARRLGLKKVAFIGAIGQDADGEKCRKRLMQEDVETLLIEKRDAHTAYAAILTAPNGDTQVTVYPGAAMLLNRADVANHAVSIRTAGALLLNGEIPEEAFDEAVCIAKEADVTIFLNPAPVQPFMRKYLKDMTAVLPNEAELTALLNPAAQDEQAIRDAMQAAGIRTLVATLGRRGALYIGEDGTEAVPAVPVTAVDTTGAGDTFCAALVVRFLRGSSIRSAVPYACAAAAVTVTHLHVLDGLPYEDEVVSD